ncbi:hypothetical protein IW492_07150 [Enterococcus sp. BWB1-3]|uniref:hypothetical protein n=1 Tax=unclassified Enterococcus TaxID=2608891 RepID=UPI001922A5D8|nr:MULTISPECIES: hypothetical protein [unclassified Enterococcus]MBL1229009.1 hypothetical protein [Enterococcus sp. BWB1-3]MCB5952278.1 hypothetical protein [Enterococcus sp. BWT-B8]MCB5955493.1 hypothetical protein [Enterococcus sp. CWB-B31]
MPKKIDLNDSYFREYQDRGIQKWQGMYLSEHTAEMEKEQKREQRVILPKKAMSENEIQELLAFAYQNQQIVAIQLEMKDLENNYFSDITGIIKGFDELGFFVDDTKVHYDEIRNIELPAFHKWSEV